MSTSAVPYAVGLFFRVFSLLMSLFSLCLSQSVLTLIGFAED